MDMSHDYIPGHFYKPVEIRVGDKGRLERVGRVWVPSIEQARAQAAAALVNPMVVRVDILTPGDVLAERILPP